MIFNEGLETFSRGDVISITKSQAFLLCLFLQDTIDAIYFRFAMPCWSEVLTCCVAKVCGMVGNVTELILILELGCTAITDDVGMPHPRDF